MLETIYERHDVYVNQKYGESDSLPYSFHLKMVLAQGLKFQHLLVPIQKVLGNAIVMRKVLPVCLVGHDLIEDARMTYNDVMEMCRKYGLYNLFESGFVADVIYAVTDEKGRNRKERKSDEFYAELKLNEVAVFVKLADTAANILYSKSFDTPQYRMYKKEFVNLKEKLYIPMFDDMFNYIESL